MRADVLDKEGVVVKNSDWDEMFCDHEGLAAEPQGRVRIKVIQNNKILEMEICLSETSRTIEAFKESRE